ncbi:hypothetical protein [Streptomyces griseomycini]|uniref:Uncharacterized protein n=1 Tax=Streptomyces griseomycini TaxID=66895 RepID=A0A7W7LVZ2_9ACTN|nr:hypothetical protein [Streptomyces griseomycini]MBB4897082.1 hypothetical protein [Streptomyces griseomycini]GGP93905.1 hypothetical protein GCM10010266_16200 [Streptomyces griseomycini]GGR30953.1 hypothetical protein GCM10015536_40740 [Streptomyces griseomycini]
MTSQPDGDGNGDAGTAEPEALVCARCGARAEGPRPTWTLSVENGVRRHYCETCSRDNLRAIEGRLDAQWW